MAILVTGGAGVPEILQPSMLILLCERGVWLEC
jgi:hypothetical protein